MSDFEINLDVIKKTALGAGVMIMDIYQKDFSIEYKDDNSPLTLADKAAHDFISTQLKKHFPRIPILSEEESYAHDYEVRKNWTTFWMIDPLDGTKEFIKKNGEFTVNIALIRDHSPVLGVVYAPQKELMYFSDLNGSFCQKTGRKPIKLEKSTPGPDQALRVVGSRSHSSPDFDTFLLDLKKKHREIEMVPMGSSLKLCLVAEGKADIYPRLGPTREWDTAAAHAVVNFAGKKVLNFNTGKELTYNKKNLLNDWFIVQ